MFLWHERKAVVSFHRMFNAMLSTCTLLQANPNSGIRFPGMRSCWDRHEHVHVAGVFFQGTYTLPVQYLFLLSATLVPVFC